jgi:hypothetical protein
VDRKVLVAAVIGGLVGWIYGVAGIFIFIEGDIRWPDPMHWPLAIFWIGGFAALIRLSIAISFGRELDMPYRGILWKSGGKAVELAGIALVMILAPSWVLFLW